MFFSDANVYLALEPERKIGIKGRKLTSTPRDENERIGVFLYYHQSFIMRKLLSFLIALFIGSQVYSQRVYFVYLQAENRQPFYVKKENIVYSSSSTGYLILPKLIDSTYNIVVGFPGQQWPEQYFSIKINKADHGFILKNFEAKGWGLFDLKTLDIQMSGSGEVKPESPKAVGNQDASSFAGILSKASDDPTLNDKQVKQPATEKITPDTQKQTEKVTVADTTTNKTSVDSKNEKTGSTELIKPIEKENTVVENIPTEAYKKTIITKKSESSTTQGFGLVFTDEKNGIADTIKLLIPNPQVIAGSIKNEPGKEEKKFLDVVNDTIVKTIEQPKIIPEPTKDSAFNSNPTGKCAIVADDNDFFKLRKQMAAAEGDESMIDEAKKYFKTKCFTVQQLKNLSLLFLNDESKYRFFDMAYPYASDSRNFAVLQAELKDEYYINRFKAMLRN